VSRRSDRRSSAKPRRAAGRGERPATARASASPKWPRVADGRALAAGEGGGPARARLSCLCSKAAIGNS
jgi:hypothetical protein